MVAGNALVVGDGLNVQHQAVLRVPLVDVDVTGTRTIRSAPRVIRGHRILRARGFHGNNRELALRKMAEELGQVRLHVVRVIRVKIKALLAGSRIEASFVLNVIVEARQVLESQLVRHGEHFALDFVDLFEAGSGYLLGRQVGGRDAANGEAKASSSVGKGPDSRIGADV